MSRTALRLAAAVPLILAVGACAGGPRHVGDITPVVQERLSGAWVLNAEESDDPQEALDAARTARGAAGRRPGGGMAPGGGAGGRGGMPGAGGRTGMPGGEVGAGAMPGRDRESRGERGRDPEAMRVMMRLVTVPPRHLEVTLSDSLVTVAYTAQDVWVLPFGEKVKRDLGGDLTLEARAEWENERLVVRRSVSGGGSVTETFMPSMDGRKLTVAVESSVGGPDGMDFRRVYDVQRPNLD